MTQTPSLSSPVVQAQPVYEITEADKRRQKRIADAWTAYHGELDPPLEPMPGQPDDNVLSNRCKAVAKRGASFLFGKELELKVEEAADPRAQQIVDATWGRKERRIPQLLKLAMNGAMAGHAFLRIVPTRKQKTFRLVAVDPSTVFVQTAPQDCETVLLYCIEYSTQQDVVSGKPEQVYYREEIARIDPDGNASRGMTDTDDTWSIQHWSRIGDRGNWVAAGEPIAWPYPFPPLFDCQNMTNPNDFWGEPDITKDLIGINNALNLTLSDISRINKLYGQPFLWGKGIGDSNLDVKPGQVTVLPPTPDSMLGAVQIASDQANALAFAGDLRSDGDELTGVPGVATGRMVDFPRGISGVVIELMHMPLLSKTAEKRCLYGELIIDVCKALFVLIGLSGDIDVGLAWQNPLPNDDLQAVQGAVLKQNVGISNSTLQRELGYDPEEEEELNATENAKKLTQFSRGQGMPPPAAPLPNQTGPALPGSSSSYGGESVDATH